MGTFQVAMAVAGGLVLAGVVAHGAWTSRKNSPRQADADPQTEPAPLSTTSGERIEPGMDGPNYSNLGNLGNDGVAMIIPAPTLSQTRGAMDALIDVIAPIAIDSLVSGDAALAAMPTTRRAGTKPFAIEGLTEQEGKWETPALGGRYTAFQAGVQLANRVGALNEIEYSEFVMKAQAFADAINGSPDFPEMLDEVSRARELDQFASAHDAQLSFTLRARSAAWSPGYIHQHAARIGFIAGVIPGRMVLPATTPGSASILGLSFDTQAALADDPAQSAIRDVTLSLDVPQVHREEQPFVRMREAAKYLAEAMDGVITDDNGQLLRDEAMDVIGHDLEQLYDTLDARELSAGSLLARRLFS